MLSLSASNSPLSHAQFKTPKHSDSVLPQQSVYIYVCVNTRTSRCPRIKLKYISTSRPTVEWLLNTRECDKQLFLLSSLLCGLPLRTLPSIFTFTSARFHISVYSFCHYTHRATSVFAVWIAPKLHDSCTKSHPVFTYHLNLLFTVPRIQVLFSTSKWREDSDVNFRGCWSNGTWSSSVLPRKSRLACWQTDKDDADKCNYATIRRGWAKNTLAGCILLLCLSNSVVEK